MSHNALLPHSTPCSLFLLQSSAFTHSTMFPAGPIPPLPHLYHAPTHHLRPNRTRGSSCDLLWPTKPHTGLVTSSSVSKLSENSLVGPQYCLPQWFPRPSELPEACFKHKFFRAKSRPTKSISGKEALKFLLLKSSLIILIGKFGNWFVGLFQ